MHLPSYRICSKSDHIAPNVFPIVLKTNHTVLNGYQRCTKCVPNQYQMGTKSYQTNTKSVPNRTKSAMAVRGAQVGAKHFRGPAFQGPQPKLARAMTRLTAMPILGFFPILLSDQSWAQRSINPRIHGYRVFGLGRFENHIRHVCNDSRVPFISLCTL